MMILTQLDPHICVAASLRLPAPGEVLLRGYMQPLALNAAQLARRSGIPATRIKAMTQGDWPVTANAALRLCMVLDTSGLYWMLLQAHHDLQQALQERERRQPGGRFRR